MAVAAAALSADPDVLYVQPDYIRHTTASTPNDPSWLDNSMWGLSRISAPAAWSAFPTAAHDVVVMVIDTGINYQHPDLSASAWTNPGEVPGNGLDDDHDGYVDDVHGIDPLNRDSDPMDDNGHGTHVAGTIGAQGNNGIGGLGVAWNPQIIGCKFLDATGSGPDSAAVACLNYAIELKVNHGINIRVTNNSWGFARSTTQPFAQALKDAFDAAGNAGIINIVAAGNDGANNDATPFDPASFSSPSIVSVAASDANDAKASFSNYGATSVDLAAPGVNILSTYGSGYAYLSGTSMATPHVTGTVALMASQNPALSVDGLKTQLLSSVDVVPQWAGLTVTGGRLNLLQALQGSTAATPGTVASIRRVQQKSVGAPWTTSQSLTFDTPTASGNTLVVAVSDYYAADPDTTISDSRNNVWRVATNYANSARLKVYYAENITGGASHQITVRSTGAQQYVVATAMEYAGVAGVSSFDGATGGRATSASYTSGSLTTTQAPDLLIGVHHVFNTSATFTPAAGWTTVARASDGAYHQHQVQEQTVTSAGKVASSGTLSASVDTQSVIVALKGGTSTPPPADTQAPTVSVTAPAANATVSGSVVVTASASDNTGVAGVQLQLDGAALGAEITTAPYSLAWDTTAVADGTHQLTAIARDAAGNRATSAAVSVVVSNATTAPAIRRVQQKSAGAPWTTSQTVTFDSATTSGDTLIVAVSDYYMADPDTAISDSRNNVWQVATNYANSARVKVYYAANITGGANHQITVRSTGAQQYVVVTAMEYSGVAGVSSLDGAAGNRGTSAAYTSGSLTTTQGPELLIGVHHVFDITTTFTPSAGWTTVARASDGVYHQQQVQQQVVSGAGSFASTGTSSAAVDTQSVVVALKGGTSAPRPPDTVAPAVSVTAPSANATVSGSVVVTASASDDTGVAGVQLQLDGAALGAEITSSPYTLTWDTTAGANGTHQLTAIARDAAGNRTTSTPVSVVVSNTASSIRRVQQKSAGAPWTTSQTLTFDAATTSGNTLIVAVSDYYMADPDTTISDSRNNVWKVATNYANSARVKVYYAENISGGANHQIVVRSTGAQQYVVITAIEYAGVASVSSFDGAAGNRGTSAAYSSGSLTTTTTQGPSLLIGVHHVFDITTTFTPSAGWTTVARASDGVYHQQQVQQQIVGGAGSFASTGTSSAAVDTQSVIVALRGGS